MTKIDIFSGFLGAGKTTLIKKLLKEALSGEKVVLIENEFGEIGIDGGFMKEAGIQVTEMKSAASAARWWATSARRSVRLSTVSSGSHPHRAERRRQALRRHPRRRGRGEGYPGSRDGQLCDPSRMRASAACTSRISANSSSTRLNTPAPSCSAARRA